MKRTPTPAPKQEILRVAARLFQRKGYDATSMSDVATALRLSKAGLYHHFTSKDEILFELMNHALEITRSRVIEPVRAISDAEERLRALIRLHVEVILSIREREITVLLHEHHPLSQPLRRRVNARKKEYMHFVETVVADAQRARKPQSPVSPRVAAFALLGMINWIYQWYKPEGSLNAEQISRQYTRIFFNGAL